MAEQSRRGRGPKGPPAKRATSSALDAAVAAADTGGVVPPETVALLAQELEAAAREAPAPEAPRSDGSEVVHLPPPVDEPANRHVVDEHTTNTAAPSAAVEANDADAQVLADKVIGIVRAQVNAPVQTTDPAPQPAQPEPTHGGTTRMNNVKKIKFLGQDYNVEATVENDKVVLNTESLEKKLTEVEKAWTPPTLKQWVVPGVVGAAVGAVTTAAVMTYGLGYERKSEGGEQPQLRAAK